MRFAFGVFAFLALFLFGDRAYASDFSPQQASSTINITNSVSVTPGTYTNGAVVLFTNQVENSTYHTVQSVIASTNGCIVVLERSLNCVNWTIVATNVFTNPGGSAEQTMTGKWMWIRLRVSGTNATGNIYYLGGR